MQLGVSPPFEHEQSELGDALAQQFGLLTVDYEQTLGIAGTLTSTQATMRGIAGTAYLAFLSLGIGNRSWALCVAAATVALLFAAQDARQSWIYHQVLRRANRMERLVQHRLQALDLPYDHYPSSRLRVELENYEFGALGQIRRFSWLMLRETLKPWSLILYLLPVALGLAAGIVV